MKINDFLMSLNMILTKLGKFRKNETSKHLLNLLVNWKFLQFCKRTCLTGISNDQAKNTKRTFIISTVRGHVGSFWNIFGEISIIMKVVNFNLKMKLFKIFQNRSRSLKVKQGHMVRKNPYNMGHIESKYHYRNYLDSTSVSF